MRDASDLAFHALSCYRGDMGTILTYRGRAVSEADIAFIRELIARHADSSRRVLSYRLCDAWGWVQPNGIRRDMVCRGLMLALHRAGHIELPPVRRTPRNNIAERVKPKPVDIDRSPIRVALSELGPIELRQVRRTGDDEALFNGLVEQHHYLGYTQPVGEHLKFLLCAKDRPVACFAWASSMPRLAPRDRFLGWSRAAQERNVQLIAYNSRFLILPWIEVRHLASHVLGRVTRELSRHWEQVYGHPIYLAETYVDRERFAGTCYRAANWIHIGKTTGRGKLAATKAPTRSKKDVLVWPLKRRFRELLQGEA